MIHWGALGLVTVATLTATMLVVGAVAAGILALSTAADHPDPGRRRLLRSAGYGALALAGCMVLFGIYLIVPQLH